MKSDVLKIDTKNNYVQLGQKTIHESSLHTGRKYVGVILTYAHGASLASLVYKHTSSVDYTQNGLYNLKQCVHYQNYACTSQYISTENKQNRI